MGEMSNLFMLNTKDKIKNILKGSDNYTKGVYNVGNIKMYVNSGIGTQDYKFRFNNRPSIDLFRLYNN